MYVEWQKKEETEHGTDGEIKKIKNKQKKSKWQECLAEINAYVSIRRK